MTDKDFLNFIADRLSTVYGESPNVDFVLRLREVADRVEHVHDMYDCRGCDAMYDKGYKRGREDEWESWKE